MMRFGKRPKKLPTVLSRQEIEQLITCTANLKHRTFIMALYACGLRYSAAANLRIHHIDGQRMQVTVACGKGKKERRVPLSPRLLKELRTYWTEYRPSDLLFPGKTPEKIYADTSIRKAIKKSAKLAGIRKNVYTQELRRPLFSERRPPQGRVPQESDRPTSMASQARQAQTELKLGGKYESLRNEDEWDAYIEKLEAKAWVVFIQHPPTATSGVGEVVNYLTRYLSSRRLHGSLPGQLEANRTPCIRTASRNRI